MIKIDYCNLKFKNGFELNVENIVFKQGEQVHIIGESGSGKSVFIKAILNLIKCKSKIYKIEKENKILNTDIRFRDNIAYLSQDNLIWEHLSVEEHINFVLSNGKTLKYQKETDEFLEIFNLQNRKKEKANNLSFGERQRLSCAVVLASKPKYLFLDEPFSNLDVVNINMISSILKEFYKKNNFCVINITHNYIGIDNSDRVVVFDKGRILFDGFYENIDLCPSEWVKEWRQLL